MAIRNIFKKESGEQEPKKIAAKKASKVVERKADPKEKKTDFAWKVLKNPHVTEKGTLLSESNQYVFNVFKSVNKFEVKRAVEGAYAVNVESVKIVNVPAKKVRLGRTLGWKEGYKKAIVKIREGQKIELMPR